MALSIQAYAQLNESNPRPLTIDVDTLQSELARYENGVFDDLPEKLTKRIEVGAVTRCIRYGRNGHYTALPIQVLIGPTKKRSGSRCWPTTTDEGSRLSSVIVRRANAATPIGATLFGKEVNTALYFTVRLSEINGKRVVQYFPNWGIDADTYGNNYEAPQRVIGSFSAWRDIDCPVFPVVLSTVPVDAAGVPQDGIILKPYDVINVVSFSPRCQRILTDHLAQSKYIPAKLGGKPIPAHHVELWR